MRRPLNANSSTLSPFISLKTLLLEQKRVIKNQKKKPTVSSPSIRLLLSSRKERKRKRKKIKKMCKKGFACKFSSTTSGSVFLLMVPLVVVSVFFATFGSKTSSGGGDWPGFISGHYPTWLWFGSSYGDNYYSLNDSAAAMQASGGGDDGGNIVVMGVSGGGGGGGGISINNSTEEENAYDTSFVVSQPPAPLEDMHVVQETLISKNTTKDEDEDEDDVLVSSSKTPADEATINGKSRGKTEYTNLERLELGLLKARTAIREAKSGNQTQDSDYVPVGPMYWNSKVFHRSYLEMEKQFKVFVYEEGEPPVFHDGPCRSIYSMEGNFIHRMEMDDQFRTRDPEKAHVYFLPFSVARMVQFVYVRDSHDFGPIRRTVLDYVNLVAGKYPYWNRSLGADHFMLACHDWGPEASFSVPQLGKNSIRALCNANTSERFNPMKDVSFPEINLQTGTIEGLIGAPSASKRPILAFFAGGLHGPIRPIVLEYWENKDEDIQVHQYLPKGVSYYNMLKRSKFCLCPSGYEVASPRVVEAIYTGCVPVLISDHYVPPFSDVLNWKSFSVEVSVNEIPNLKKILTSISPRQYIRMQRRVIQIRRHFEVHSPPKRYDVFHLILHSIWLRRLNVGIHNDQLAITS